MKEIDYKPMDFVYIKSETGNDLLVRYWEKVALDLMAEKASPDQFVQKMIEVVYGENKTTVIIDKHNPYPAIVKIKDLCKNNILVRSLIKDLKNKETTEVFISSVA